MRKSTFVSVLTSVLTFSSLATAQAQSAFSNAVTALNPVAYWPLNETTAPPGTTPAEANLGSGGAALNATYTNSVTFGAPGALAGGIDTSAKFDGVTARAFAPYNASVSTASSFTIEAWLLSDNTGSTECPLSDVDVASPRSGWLIYMDIDNAGQYTFRTYNKNGTSFSLAMDIGAAGSIAQGTWNHLAVVVSNTVAATNVYGYVNGVLVAGPTALPSFVPNDGLGGASFSIGARSDGGFGFDGNIDEVAFYPSALDATTVASHYSAGTNTSPATSYSALVLNSSPLLYYHMEQSATPLAKNYGSLGSAADGYYQSGTVPGVVGPGFGNLPNGFGGSDFATQFSPNGTQSTGSGPSVTCAFTDPAVLNDASTITVAAWVKVPTAAPGWFSGILGRGDSSYRFAVDPSGLPHFADGGNGNGDIVGANALNDGNWHFWVGSYNAVNSNASFYIDKAVVGTAQWNPIPGNTDKQFLIGGAPDYSGRNFVGEVAQVAIFSNALSASQVQTLYSSTAPTSYEVAVANLNPQGYYPLNETVQPPAALDVVALTNSGSGGTNLNLNPPDRDIIFGAVSPLVGEPTDTADYFDGTTYALALATNTVSIQPPFTIEGWFLAKNVSATGCPVSDIDANSPRSGWLVYMDISNPGQYSFRTYNQNGTTPSLTLNIGAAGSIVPNQWYHLAVVFDSSHNASGYLNGVLAAGPTNVSGYVPNDLADGGFSVGARSDTGFPFEGAVDEVAFYTTALSGATIASHYAAGTNTSPATPYEQLVAASSPLLYYRCNESKEPLSGPYPEPLPVAHNYGASGAAGDGFYTVNSLPGQVPGPTNGGLNALPALELDPSDVVSTDTSGPGVWAAPYDSTLYNDTGALTVTFWAQSPTAPNWFSSVLGRGDSSWRFDVDQSGLPHFAAAPNSDLVGPTSISDNQWHYWAGVFDPVALTGTFYIDGVVVASSSWAALSGDPGRPLLIGGVPDYYNQARNFYGNIAQVAIFTNALTPTQVNSLYSAAGAAPNIVIPIKTLTNNAGTSATITASVGGTIPMSLQWYQINTSSVTQAVAGATSATLSLTDLPFSDNGFQYFLVASNAFGSFTSSIVTLTVLEGPPILQLDISPSFAQLPVGVTDQFGVSATGTEPFYYHWFLNSNVIAAATNPIYSFPVLSGTNYYYGTISNAFGSTASSVAEVVGVLTPPPIISFNTNGATDWSTNSAAGPGFTYPDFTTNGLLLTDGNGSEASSAFYIHPQYIGGFVASFNYIEANGTAPLADGSTFCIQADPNGTNALGDGGGDLGFYGITNSFGYEINIYSGAHGGVGQAYGTEGATPDSPIVIPPYTPTSPVNFASGDTIHVAIFFADGIMTVTLTDLTSGATFTSSNNFGDVISILGSASGYIGFTGATGGLNSIQTVSNFKYSYTTPPVLSVTTSNNVPIITWPVSVSTLFQLQSASAVAGPYTNVTTAPSVVGGTNELVTPGTGTAGFYRLVLQ